MLRTRIIPCLQLVNQSLVKTIQFEKFNYIGDPINTVRIFNELEVDELCFLDIRATVETRQPNLKILSEISNECFMPLSYGGGLNDFETVKNIFALGVEKVVINSFAHIDPSFITKISEHYGIQSVIASIDCKKNIFGKYSVYSHDGTVKTKYNPVEWAIEVEKRGAGEILLTSMDKDGTWEGFDIDLIKSVTKEVKIPVIANGGAGKLEHIFEAVKKAGASAAALGSMVVYQKKDMGVLINFPDKTKLERGLL